ncbi:hypothetical protein VTN00DRAFT_7798 [Thermoascus crustaceus]|uniref:uncharacterized protein n=1 Tax=Thermoascus crustaceus TaxID=5088 RepID=UPI0037440D70
MPRPARKRAAGKAAKSQPKSKRAKAQPPSSEVQTSDDIGEVEEDGSDSGSDSSSDGSSLDTTEEAREAIKELQSFIESTSSVKKKKKENGESSKAFEKWAKEEEKRLLGMLEDFEKEMKSEQEKFETEFAELMAAALAPTGLKPPPSTEPLPIDPIPDNHPLYILSKTLLDNLRALVDEYEGLQADIANLRAQAPGNPASRMEKDYEEARRIITVGKEASAAEIEKLLGSEKQKKDKKEKKKKRHQQKKASKKSLADNDDHNKNDDGIKEAFDKDVHLQAMLKMGREEIMKKNGNSRVRKAYGWGKVAYRAEKAMKALVKALPDEKS